MMLLSSFITFIGILYFGKRPAYGRYSSESKLKNAAIPARLAWFLQEVPSFILPIIGVWQAGALHITNLIVIFMFTLHYAQRSFIYPYLIRGGKPTPADMFILGFIFCSWNGYIQGFYHAKYAIYSANHTYKFASIIGLIFYAVGMAININSDAILRNLRKPGETGYSIPRGGLFEFISGANFFGEIIEWVGYAIFAQTLTAMAFALFTFSNVVPRAINHHKWYLEKFDDYPKNRKAVIPFLL